MPTAPARRLLRHFSRISDRRAATDGSRPSRNGASSISALAPEIVGRALPGAKRTSRTAPNPAPTPSPRSPPSEPKSSRRSAVYARRRWTPQTYVPGKTPAPYAGRVFDEEEVVSLVDASLDFWLTSGRFCRQLEKGSGRIRGCDRVSTRQLRVVRQPSWLSPP